MASAVVEPSKSEIKQVGKLKYDPKKEIDRGGYGIVYEGLFEDQSGRNLDVAIKRIIRSYISESAEADLLKKATGHPNILRILCCEKDLDFLYIATELCSGTLNDLIRGRIKGLHKETVDNYKKEILYQITQGLHHLHSKKIVHRDIKPDNILVIAYKSAASGEIIKLQMKIADFSHCRIRKEHKMNFSNTNMSNPTGTRGWIAPELYESEAYDIPVDVFALGCVYGFTLTDGEHPFGDDFREFRIMKKEPMLWTLDTFKTLYLSTTDDNFTVFKLIQRMVEIYPKNRPTSEKVLEDDYFQHLTMNNHQGNLHGGSISTDLLKEEDFEVIKPELRNDEGAGKSVLNITHKDEDRFESKADAWEMDMNYDRKYILARGSYGAVFKGVLKNTEDKTKRKVAIKRMERAWCKEGEMDLELLLMNMDHPNVIKLLHIEKDEDFIYHVIELCDASLDRVFFPQIHPYKYRGPLPNDVDFTLQLSLGLEYIHSHNIVHRDISPSNVLILSKSTSTVLVKWFGFDIIFRRTTKNGEFSMSGARGTSMYFAPEIAEIIHNRSKLLHKKIVLTTKIDIFAFACILFEFFTNGIHPFGSNYQEIITNIASKPIPINLKGLRESHFAYETVKKMLAAEPNERPNLREIIPILTSLKYKINGISEMVIDKDAEYQQLNNMKEKLITICSLVNPNEEQIQKLMHLVTEDTSGIRNIPDENGCSPLILLCRNRQNESLLRCIKALLKTHPTAGKYVIDMNYQDRNGFTALHHLCMNNYFHKDFLAILKLLITNHDIDLNKTDREFDRNALQSLLQSAKDDIRADLIDIVKIMIENGNIDLNHQSAEKIWTVLHYVCKYYSFDNLLELIEILKGNGADINAEDSDGLTALQVFCEQQTKHKHFRKIVPLLL